MCPFLSVYEAEPVAQDIRHPAGGSRPWLQGQGKPRPRVVSAGAGMKPLWNPVSRDGGPQPFSRAVRPCLTRRRAVVGFLETKTTHCRKYAVSCSGLSLCIDHSGPRVLLAFSGRRRPGCRLLKEADLRFLVGIERTCSKNETFWQRSARTRRPNATLGRSPVR